MHHIHPPSVLLLVSDVPPQSFAPVPNCSRMQDGCMLQCHNYTQPLFGALMP